ncbi:MAG TPA: TorF family putative porin [Usitatibacteraceae bacterium]|nr:TorF family putative porin [Usitatibacteraceae bacterium]
MNKIAKPMALAALLAASLAGTQAFAQSAPAAAAPATPEHTLVPKISVYSEYEYRGISQTSEKPALQFNLDYSHSSGFYLGTFISNIKWLKDYKSIGAVSDSAAVEIDLFGGYKFEVVKDVTLDLGYLHYEYPSAKGLSGLPKPNTDEIYVGLSYDAWNVKYSYSTGDTFGVPKSKGTTFLELNFAKEIAPKLTLTAQIAQQKYKGNFAGFDNDKELTYSVYKAGLAYDLGDGWTVGGYAKDTNAKEANYTVKGKDWSKGRLVAFVSKSF